MSSEKRKKVVISMEQKLSALQRLDKGYNEGPEKADRVSHSAGLNSIETALTLNNKGRRPLQTHYCSGAGVTLPQRKGRRLRCKYPLKNLFKNKLSFTNLHCVEYDFCL
jgi:hypothetical protein